MADAADSKSAAPCGRVGSTPISGTTGLLICPPRIDTPKDRGHLSGAPFPSSFLLKGSRLGQAWDFLPWSTSMRAAVLSAPVSV